MNKSSTPMTDSMANSADRFGDREVVPAYLARKIEAALRALYNATPDCEGGELGRACKQAREALQEQAK